MAGNNTVMISGECIECEAKETDGLSCYELFGFPLVCEHNDPNMFVPHFWLVSCYMIQHLSNYTEEGYKHLVNLFIKAYDDDWETPYILKRNREIVRSLSKITNPVQSNERKRQLRLWPMTIEDIYLGGEQNAIVNINKWKGIRSELKT